MTEFLMINEFETEPVVLFFSSEDKMEALLDLVDLLFVIVDEHIFIASSNLYFTFGMVFFICKIFLAFKMLGGISLD